MAELIPVDAKNAAKDFEISVITTGTTFSYPMGARYVLVLMNGATALNKVSLKGSAPRSSFFVKGIGNIDLSLGIQVAVLASNQIYAVPLYPIMHYLAGGIVTITRDATMNGFLLNLG